MEKGDMKGLEKRRNEVHSTGGKRVRGRTRSAIQFACTCLKIPTQVKSTVLRRRRHDHERKIEDENEVKGEFQRKSGTCQKDETSRSRADRLSPPDQRWMPHVPSMMRKDLAQQDISFNGSLADSFPWNCEFLRCPERK